MTVNDLKCGLFGYRKDSVYRYVVSLEEQGAARLREKEEQLAQAEERSSARIRALEEELERVREENEKLLAQQKRTAAALSEAREYADKIDKLIEDVIRTEDEKPEMIRDVAEKQPQEQSDGAEEGLAPEGQEDSPASLMDLYSRVRAEEEA